MRILVAPEKFKGTLTARAAAEAMARGAARAVPDASIDVMPLADGGRGTVDALLAAIGGTTEDVVVSGPLGKLTTASYANLLDGRTALEMASASGMELVAADERDALAATSLGTGELILGSVARAFATRRAITQLTIVVGVGDSASSDGGTGAAAALGWRFLDKRGRELPPGGGALVDLARIDEAGARTALDGLATFVGACDVDNPLVGEAGSARVFAAQKGASPADVDRLEDGLANLAERIRADLGVDVGDRPMAGAGGGMGAGLAAFFDAELVSGFRFVAEAANLEARIAEVHLVITGEGRLDAQSGRGKTTAGVARMATRSKARCVAVAGQIELDDDALRALGFEAWATLDGGDAFTAVERATESLVRASAAG